ncbi:MAG: MG2 domain-containing protein, partial [Armatimonadetes bacterium]|nr:MG2 domain-containing protein [Armatimonadota bacterium]
MNTLDRRQRLATLVAWGIVAGGSIVFLLSIVLAQGNGGQLHPLGVRLIAPAAFLVDSPGAVSIVTTNHARRVPAGGVNVVVRLASKDGTEGVELVRGRTNRQGTLDARFRVPDLQPGTYELHVDASAGGLTERLVQPIELRREWSILLVTDKPLYQPSQVIHMRALVTRRPDVKPVAKTDVTFEVRDSKGNKVFKKVVRTNEFGAAWADFQLADEINMGEYQCKAIAGDAEAQKAVTVKRYVLPKFKVTVSTDRDFYLPATKLSGSVAAGYFFGKPVAGGKVVITAKTFDVEYTKIAQVEGKTNDEGAFTFTIDLPRHFVGQPFEQGKAFVELEVAVTDTADHTEKVTLTRPVVAQELQIHAVPESGTLVPNVPNNVWVLVSEPSGKPVKGRVRLDNATADEPWAVEWSRQTAETDDLGIAQVTITPKISPEAARAWGLDTADVGEASMPAPPVRGRHVMVAPDIVAPDEGMQPTGPIHLSLAARAPSGQVSKTTVDLPTGMATDNETILLRADKALAKVGNTLRLTALTSVATGYVYFDVIKDRQTMLTAAADLRGGRAETEITLGPELAGTIYVSAYRITRRGNVVRDTRPIIVDPASDLRIGVRASRDVYRPGEPARVDFEVRTAAGKPAQAAIGVSVVDESVFALQEMQPGLERVYAYLEEELRKPRYEIHGLELPVIIARPLPAVEERAQRAAQVMLAAVDLEELRLRTQDSYLKRLEAAKAEWVKKILPKLVVVRRALQQYMARRDQPPTVKEGAKALVEGRYLKPEDLKDLWGREMKLEPTWPGMDRLYDVALLSAGPDGIFDTEDDVLVIEPEMEGRPRSRPGIFFRAMKGAGVPEAMMAEGDAFPAAAAPGMGGAAGPAAPEAKPVRVREYFPETLLFRPDLITDEAGRATLEFKMADSITTWRMTALANSAAGELGSPDAPLRCFQDFFVDLNLPLALTQGDEVSLPVAVYNYLTDRQTVRLKLETQPWFSLSGEAEQTLDIAPNEVT